MKVKWIICLIMLGTTAQSEAQSGSSYEEDTRYLFEQKRWSALATLSERALNEGFETYAVRYRYSVALLETGRWNEAERQLKLTIDMNPFDRDPRYLLRNLYLKTGRQNDADRIANVDFLRMAAIEYGQKNSDVDDVGRLDYADVSIRHRLARGSSLTWSGAALRQPVYWGDIRQQQGYLRLDQSFDKNWQFTGALTYLDYSFSLIGEAGVKDEDAWVGSLELAKRFTALAVRAQFSASNLYERTNLQTGVKLEMYPGKWASWKVVVNPFLLNDETITKRGLLASVHWFHEKNTEISVNGYSSDAYNTVEDTGYLINNSLDQTRYRAGLYAQRNIVDRFPAFLVLQYEWREERFYEFPYHTVGWFAGLKYQL